MCELARLHSGKARHVQCRNAKICRQLECYALHSMPKYAFYLSTLHHANLVLVFTKLASQLTADTIGELMLIPVIFLVQTLVSYLCSIGVSRLFRFKKRRRNFVIAMGVIIQFAPSDFGMAKGANMLRFSATLTLYQSHWYFLSRKR